MVDGGSMDDEEKVGCAGELAWAAVMIAITCIALAWRIELVGERRISAEARRQADYWYAAYTNATGIGVNAEVRDLQTPDY